MHIELTDHLRCPMSHPESFVVLLPEVMEGRRVLAGTLGCPTCGWGTAWTDAIPDFGGGTPAESWPAFDAAGAITLLGLEGPGGWLAVAGSAGRLAPDLAALLPGVAVVAVNPPTTLIPDGTTSVIRSGVWPLKRHAMRGVLVGPDAAPMAAAALASVLPGLRVAGQGPLPTLGVGDEIIAEAGEVWVIRKG